ncbi:MAG: hypothetical protein LBL55_05850, partial [Propionibacteriaceae bacterium]|nr:hypothetical protein [Propionibacteriaceae bacterium]
VNHKVAEWLQDEDIRQTRSRPYKKNDQATVESKNNHRVRTPDQIAAFEAGLTGTNPADLTRRINAIQNQLTELARDKTEDLADSLPLDMTPLKPSINRSTKTK